MSEENVISNVEDNSPKNEGVVEKVIEIFKNGWNKQVILYGPPGTSKTYSATIIAAKLLAGSDRVDTQNPYNSAQELLKNEYKDNYDVGVKTINKFNPIPYSTLKNSYFVVYRRGLGNI